MVGVVEAAPDLRDLLLRVERDFNKYAGGCGQRGVGGRGLRWLAASVQAWLLVVWYFCG